MAKPIEDNDNAKEFWESLSDASALDEGTKTALRERIGATGDPMADPDLINALASKADATATLAALNNKASVSALNAVAADVVAAEQALVSHVEAADPHGDRAYTDLIAVGLTEELVAYADSLLADATSEATADTIAKRDNNGGSKFAYVRVVGGAIVLGSDGGSTTSINDGSTIDRVISTPDADGVLALTSSNVATATALQTGRTINGVSFNGTANITVVVAISTGVSGLGSNVAVALAISVGNPGAMLPNGGTATGMTFAGTTTINSTTITFGTGAAAAMRTALELDRAAGFELFCVLRNTAGTWAMLNDATHEPYNISSVSQSGYNVRINYSKTATKVGSLIVVPDETYTARGLIVGASVGTTFADINLSGLNSAGILTFNGSTWAASSAVGITSAVMTGTQIVVTHDDAGANHANVSIYCQNYNYFTILSASTGGTSSFRIINPLTGLAMTAAELPSGLTVSFSRRGNGLALAVSGAVSSSNLWVYGIMYK